MPIHTCWRRKRWTNVCSPYDKEMAEKATTVQGVVEDVLQDNADLAGHLRYLDDEFEMMSMSLFPSPNAGKHHTSPEYTHMPAGTEVPPPYMPSGRHSFHCHDAATERLFGADADRRLRSLGRGRSGVFTGAAIRRILHGRVLRVREKGTRCARGGYHATEVVRTCRHSGNQLTMRINLLKTELWESIIGPE